MTGRAISARPYLNSAPAPHRLAHPRLRIRPRRRPRLRLGFLATPRGAARAARLGRRHLVGGRGRRQDALLFSPHSPRSPQTPQPRRLPRPPRLPRHAACGAFPCAPPLMPGGETEGVALNPALLRGVVRRGERRNCVISWETAQRRSDGGQSTRASRQWRAPMARAKNVGFEI